MKLAISELIGDANDTNTEVDKYLKVTAHDLQRVANEILYESNCSTLIYTKLAH